MTEAEIQNAILLHYGREPDVTLFRNNTGVAKSEVVTPAHLDRMLGWLSAALQKHGTGAAVTYTRQTADLVRALLTERARFTRYGLCEGSSDIIGIVQRYALRDVDGVGTEGHVGVFVALEVKTIKGVVSAPQQAFLDTVNRRGGVGRVVRSVEDAGAAIQEAREL